jgi:hypothetical protein
MKIISAEDANKIMGYELYPGDEFPEGFREKLEGKALEEQMEFFRITTSSRLAKTSYGEIAKESIDSSTCRLQDFDKFSGLVVDNGIIVGVLIKAWAEGDMPVQPYHCVCTYIGIDNNGAGTSERDENAYLICI